MDKIVMPITGKKVKIALSDFPGIMEWEEANNACKSLGKGWRLPTFTELKEMHKFQKEIGGFCNLDGNSTDILLRPERFNDYWSSDNSEEYPGCFYKLTFNEDLDSTFNNGINTVKDGSHHLDRRKVRAVKTAR
jgi:hypothetical protein